MTLTVGGKYHCNTGLQFNWIGFDQTRKYVVMYCTLCGGISATHFPKSKKHIYFCDRKLKFGTVVGTYVYYFGLKFQLDIFSGSGDN